MPDSLQLAIIKGVGAVGGDTQSAESSIEVLDLLDARGFSVAPDGWVPKLAQPKSQAVYADTPLTDGRTPVAIARGNVVEQIKLTAVAATWDARYWLESKLAKLSRDAQNFHTGLSQIEPVYLKWWAHGAPGPQYALIYSIDIAQNTPAFLPVNVNELQITIEREPYWRGLAPGACSKAWSLYENGVTYSASDLSLYAGSNHFAEGTINNRTEWNATYDAMTSDNFIDLPDVPGDAPALLTVTVEYDDAPTNSLRDVYMALSHNRHSLSNRQSENYLQFMQTPVRPAHCTIFGTGTLSTPTDDTNGLYLVGGDATKRYNNFAFSASQGGQFDVGFGGGFDVDAPYFDPTLMRGTFAVFVRCFQRDGAYGDVDLQLKVMNSSGLVDLILPKVKAPLNSGGSTFLPCYLGTITLPMDGQVTTGLDGLGITGFPKNQTALWFRVTLGNNAAAARNFRVIDMTFLKVDDGLCLAKNLGSVLTDTGNKAYVVFDNTAYLTHGKPEDVAYVVNPNTGNNGPPRRTTELSGRVPCPRPGGFNRLYFFFVQTNGYTYANENYPVRVNIIPRWSGVRDV